MIRQQARAMLASIKIGWKIESNWTRVPIYILYAAIRPLSLCVLLYFLYKVVDPTPGDDPRFLGIFIGNTFFMVFVSLAGSLSWAIITDREHFQLIRYVYIAPTPFVWTILGRAITFLGIALSSVLVILLVGRYTLDLPLHLSLIRWDLLIVSFTLGLIAAASMGIFFAGLALVTARHSMLLAEGVGGTLLLVCGVLYPTTFMPWFLRPLAWLNPLTHWIEASRRAFSVTGFDSQLGAMSDWLLLLILAVLTAIYVILGFKGFTWFEDYAKHHGKIDQTTNY